MWNLTESNLTDLTDFPQFIDSLPDSITMNVAILRQWCITHSWSNFEISNEFKFYAVPPGDTRHLLLPQSAFAELEQNKDLLEAVQSARGYQQDIREGRQYLITSSLLTLTCFGLSILTVANAVTNVPAALIVPREIRKEFNLLTAGVIGVWLVVALITLLKYWKYCSLKNKIAMLSYKFFKPYSGENEN